jgi:hypothetical protein
MDSQNLPVTIKCRKCGGDMLVLPDNPTDDSIVTCQSCGIEVGRWGDIKAAALNTVQEKITEDIKGKFRESFKDFKSITFK